MRSRWRGGPSAPGTAAKSAAVKTRARQGSQRSARPSTGSDWWSEPPAPGVTHSRRSKLDLGFHQLAGAAIELHLAIQQQGAGPDPINIAVPRGMRFLPLLQRANLLDQQTARGDDSRIAGAQ